MTYDPKQLVFLDTETTGLWASVNEAWEIAAITMGDSGRWEEHLWWVWPDLRRADPTALAINKFYERTDGQDERWQDAYTVAREIAYLFSGKHIVGACPWFDANFLERLLFEQGFAIPWHYHMIDVEALAIGYLAGMADREFEEYFDLELPWKTDWLMEQLELDRPPTEERHTAMGDAREVQTIYLHIMGDEEFIEDNDPRDDATIDLVVADAKRVLKDSPQA